MVGTLRPQADSGCGATNLGDADDGLIHDGQVGPGRRSWKLAVRKYATPSLYVAVQQLARDAVKMKEDVGEERSAKGIVSREVGVVEVGGVGLRRAYGR